MAYYTKLSPTKYGHHNRYGLVWQLRIPSPPRWLHAAAFAAVESSAERPSRRGAQCNKHYMHCTGHRLSQASWSEGEKHLPSWGLSKKWCQMTVMMVAINECIRWLEIFLESTFMLPCDMPSAWWNHRTFVSMAEASWTPQSGGWLQRSQQAKHTLRENLPIVKNAIPNIETNQKMQKSHLREPRTNPSSAANHGATFFYFRSAWSEIAGCFLNVCRLQVLWYSIKPTTQKVWGWMIGWPWGARVMSDC